MQAKTVAFLLLAALFLMPMLNNAQAAEIDDIKAAIVAKHAKWTAKDTPLHQMDPALRRIRSSLILPTLATATPASKTTLSQPLTAPGAGLDWRNFGGINYVTAAKDQKDCGSCWAFASTGALESYTLIHGAFNTTLDLSEQIMISCSGAGSCNGGTLDGAANFNQQTGLPTDSMDPYVDGNGVCTKATANWQSVTDKIAAWEWINSSSAPNITTVKNALYTYGPLVASMKVYSDFSTYSGGVYSYTTGPYEGAHAILIIGYADDATVSGGGYFIVKNSWGQKWGEPFANQTGGYFRIAYSETTSPVQFAQNVLAYDAAVQTCSYGISSSSASLAGAGGTGSFSVTTSSSCTWSAKSSASWLTTSGTAGKGNGSIGYTVVPNTGTSARTGTVTVVNAYSTVVDTFTVTQQPQQAASAGYYLSGVVKANSSTGAAVPGVTVSLGNQTATSDSTGSFLISGIPAGKYALKVSKDGYAPYANSAFNVSSNQNVTVILPQIFTLSGTVTSGSAGGAALSGALVSINGMATASTGTSGGFTITGIPAGTYAVTISKPGFSTYSNSALKITANQTITAALVPASYTVSGTVRSMGGTGSLLAGAAVSIGDKTAASAGDGTFSIAGILAGTYAVKVSKAGYTSFSTNLTIGSNLSGVSLSIAQITYQVAGTVTSGSSTGAPVSGATVTIGGKSAVTSGGAYTITGLLPGVYAMTVSKPGYLSYTNSALSVNSGLTLNTALVPITYTVGGTVRGGSGTGAPLAGAMISIGGKIATSNGSGVFSVSGVSAGTYAVSVVKAGYTSYANAAYAVSGSQVLNPILAAVTVSSSKK
jgi:hypothetical protein